MKHILFIFLFIGLANSGQAQITVDRNIIDLSAGARRADINVSNTGKNTETVDISLFAIIDPGLDSEQRHSPENPRELGVLATPRQFTLAPGQSRKVRISFLKTATVKDGIYRMRVTPRSESSGNSNADFTPPQTRCPPAGSPGSKITYREQSRQQQCDAI